MGRAALLRLRSRHWSQRSAYHPPTLPVGGPTPPSVTELRLGEQVRVRGSDDNKKGQRAAIEWCVVVFCVNFTDYSGLCSAVCVG